MELKHTLILKEVEKPVVEKGSLYAENLPFIGDTVISPLRTSGDYYTAQLAKLNKGDKIICKLTSPNQAIAKVTSYSTNSFTYPVHNKNEKYISIEEKDAYGNEYIVVSLTEEGLNIDCEVIIATETIIDEPIGFDNMQTTFKRGDYHGMSVDVSVGELEFYGGAYSVIKKAYDTDIDSNIAYLVRTDNETIYEGKIDVTTCSFIESNYKSVKAKVGDAGVLTTFNNRINNELDINNPKTIDGIELEKPKWLNLHIPFKHLIYTNIAKQTADETITTSGGDHPYQDVGVGIATEWAFISIPIGNEFTTEFGQFENHPAYSTNDITHIEPQYVSASDHETKYGAETKLQLDINLHATIKRVTTGWDKTTGYIRWHLEAKDNSGNTIYGDEHKVPQIDVNKKNSTWDLSCQLSGELDAGNSIKYYLVFSIDMQNDDTARYFWAHINVQKNSFVKMMMYDNIIEEKPVYADTILIHDALNVVSQSISERELSVKSDWYNTPESYINKGMIGGGACKALTDGYHIRGLENDTIMKLSFKSLIESLNAMDCIGWGFSNESGNTFVRVERWDWFYQDTPIIEMNGATEIVIEVNTDHIITELKIGYKKYATTSQYNSIESPHGTRTFISGIKALSNTTEQESEFVADNYAIEEIRRAKTQVDQSEETSYDDTIFVFELMRRNGYILPDNSNLEPSYEVAHSSTDTKDVGVAKEFINAKLTPRHMAARWRDYIFSTNNATPFRFTSGEINCKSSFKVIPEDAPFLAPINTSFLQSFAVTAPQIENSDITYQHAKFKAESISFSYPLSISQYKKIKSNPYGIVKVNGLEGWIIDFKYSFNDGIAEFKLIAKY